MNQQRKCLVDGSDCGHLDCPVSKESCPQCGGELREREGHFPDCEDCGFELLSDEAIALREEARREFEYAKIEYWPDPVPPWREYIESRDERLEKWRKLK